MPWSPLPLETDPDAVSARLLDGLTTRIPGYVLHEGSPEVALALEIGRETAATNTRTITAADAAVAGFGESVHGVTPHTGDPATLPVRITVTGPGAVVPAGFRVESTTTAGIAVAFALRNALTAAGTNVLATLVATDVGTVYNDVPAGPLDVVTATATVVSIAATAPSSGGIDPETLTSYLDRLADYIAILRPGGVRASDLAVIARSTPGVARALAVDLYDATSGMSGQERTVSLFPLDAAGQPVSAGVATALRAALEAVREVNFIFRVGTPTYVPINVAVSVVPERGADPALVAAAVRADVLAWLSPVRWGSSSDDVDDWQPTPAVRRLELASVVGSASGVAFAQSLTLNGSETDALLPGVASLPAPAVATAAAPTPSTVSVTVL